MCLIVSFILLGRAVLSGLESLPDQNTYALDDATESQRDWASAVSKNVFGDARGRKGTLGDACPSLVLQSGYDLTVKIIVLYLMRCRMSIILKHTQHT